MLTKNVQECFGSKFFSWNIEYDKSCKIFAGKIIHNTMRYQMCTVATTHFTTTLNTNDSSSNVWGQVWDSVNHSGRKTIHIWHWRAEDDMKIKELICMGCQTKKKKVSQSQHNIVSTWRNYCHKREAVVCSAKVSCYFMTWLPHITTDTAHWNSYQILPHPPFSLNLASPDVLFWKLKDALHGTSSTVLRWLKKKMLSAVEAQDKSNTSKESMWHYSHRWKKCADLLGD